MYEQFYLLWLIMFIFRGVPSVNENVFERLNPDQKKWLKQNTSLDKTMLWILVMLTYIFFNQF